ncbi:MAG: peptidoglycan-binding protein [Christensenellales bacterium]|jgi:peptidoglycan hydrolase-like protein with peptidoglycan-binding domain
MKKRIISLLVCAALLLGVMPALAYTLRYEDTGTRVGLLQTQLKNLGYYTGPLSNKYDYELVKSVRSFQRENGLQVDGIAGLQTLMRLNSLDGIAPKPKPKESVLMLSLGSQGDLVTDFQTRLKDLGYLSNVSGSFDTTTYAAVTSFQKHNGLRKDGIVGDKTWSALFSPTAKKAPGYNGTPLYYNYISLTHNNPSEQVRQIEQRLKDLGYFSGTPNTVFDADTFNAVLAFQRKNSLKVDGIVGYDTWNRLFSSSAISSGGTVVPPPSTTTPPVLPTDPPKINTAGRLQYNYEDPQVRVLQKKLADLGYFDTNYEKISDLYTYYTVVAVRNFQKKNGLKADGIAGPNTLTLLFKGDPIKADGKKASEPVTPIPTGPAPTPAPITPKTDIRLQYNQENAQIGLLKARLKELGYFDTNYEKISNVYTYYTVVAVRNFQKKNGLKADGIAGANTLKALYSDSAIKADGKAAGGEGGGSAPPVSTDKPKPKEPIRLSYGDENSNVTKLQEKLTELKFFDPSYEKISGKYTYYTVKCVRKFQESKGLKADGVVGPKTWEALGFAN